MHFYVFWLILIFCDLHSTHCGWRLQWGLLTIDFIGRFVFVCNTLALPEEIQNHMMTNCTITSPSPVVPDREECSFELFCPQQIKWTAINCEKIWSFKSDCKFLSRNCLRSTQRKKLILFTQLGRRSDHAKVVKSLNLTKLMRKVSIRWIWF